MTAAPRPRPTAGGALPRFAIVGGLGVVVNETALFALHGMLGVPLLVGVALATELAILWNYLGNELWTFHLRKLSLARLARFNTVALGGLLITVATMAALERLTPLHYLVDNLIAIGAGSLWNFTVNFGWTWGPRARERAGPARRKRS